MAKRRVLRGNVAAFYPPTAGAAERLKVNGASGEVKGKGKSGEVKGER
jgi:hypothetical protein